MLMINIQVSCDLLWKPGNQKVVGSGPSRSDPWAFTFVSLIKTPLVIPGGTCPVKTFMMPFYDRKLNYWKSFPPALVLRWWIANLLLLYLLFLNVNVFAFFKCQWTWNCGRDNFSGVSDEYPSEGWSFRKLFPQLELSSQREWHSDFLIYPSIKAENHQSILLLSSHFLVPNSCFSRSGNKCPHSTLFFGCFYNE